MTTITDIKNRIQTLSPANFQEFCDCLIYKNGYGKVHGYGMKAGTGKTTIGNPDSYFRKDNGKYVFVAYTTQQNNIYAKIKEDIDKCLDKSKTKLSITDIDEIICCHTSSNLSAGDDKNLHEYCANKGISLTIWGIDEIANQIFNNFRSLIRELGLSIDTNQIMDVDSFVSIYDANEMLAPLSTQFQFRESEKKEILTSLYDNEITIVTGKSGVGKTRLVLETVRIFSLQENYILLCVKNNSLGLYDDLISVTEKPGKYLFFVDDANELAELNLILEYITKILKGYEVKIILTVRDYVKCEVIKKARLFALPKVVELFSFSDKEIECFLNKNLNIFNIDYIKQIIRIAEGNPRIAYMAGKLAIKNQNLASIQNASDIYDQYYRKYVDYSFGGDEGLCITAGILSIINCVLLTDLSPLEELLNMYDMSTEMFEKKVRQLYSLEFVEIQLEQLATLSDQCLSNYLLYYIFFKKRTMRLSTVLEIGYKNFRSGVINALHTILNLFESPETREFCGDEIRKVWKKLQNDSDSNYYQFVQDFHVFNPEEAFLLAKYKIENIEKEEFNVIDIHYTDKIYCREESVLKLLVGYRYSEFLDYVMELLLAYANRGKNYLISGIEWLKNEYGLQHNDYKYGYYTQVKISEYLLEQVRKEDNTAEFIALQWAKYSLDFIFHYSEEGRGDEFKFYTIELIDSERLEEYRKKCWKILIHLAEKTKWRARILSFIKLYSVNIYKNVDDDIISTDYIYIDQLFTLLNSKQIRFCQVVERIIFKVKNIGIQSSLVKKWDRIYTGSEWELYQILNKDFIVSGLDYEEHIKERDRKIIEYGNRVNITEVSKLIQTMSNILSEPLESTELFHLSRGLEQMILQFNEPILKQFFKDFMIYGSNISINPSIVLDKLNNKDDYIEILKTIKSIDFPQKNEWLYSYFETLSPSKVDNKMLKEFLTFLKDDSATKFTSSCYRNLRILDKFIVIEPNIYPIATSIIYDKQNDFISKIYFSILFHEEEYSPSELLSLYESDIELLKQVYFFIINKTSSDFDGTFLIEFLKFDSRWLERYSKIFWESEGNFKDYLHNKNKALWKSDKFLEYYDYIFYHFPKDKMYSWRVVSTLKKEFSDREDDIVNNQIKWIEHIIRTNNANDKIILIFDIICELDDEIRKIAIQTLLEINSDFKVFKKIRLIPRSWSGTGSFIPAYRKQINFLESLYPLISGIQFLEHRSKIKLEIEYLKERISEEEIRSIYKKFK
ncbi:hypothetical protein [Streptococcus sp. OH4692_COT-348]|jgi:hypothetical protein|uniref:hypothetical protein n=1 Tax=Streptococcus sp. OH4692_COT-348 TaxID=2491052 RepID=UPI000F5DF83C|nr:hypothetical protein [Streptococcus sp. OH4692_COT-348]RRD33445.1 hypothetical protein EII37_06640 [Streptococcus sp. OH4692_COT-348]